MMDFFDHARAELARANKIHGPFHSLHEGFAVLMEEVQELWEHVRTKDRERDTDGVREECVQVAAMAGKMVGVIGEGPDAPNDTTKYARLDAHRELESRVTKLEDRHPMLDMSKLVWADTGERVMDNPTRRAARIVSNEYKPTMAGKDKWHTPASDPRPIVGMRAASGQICELTFRCWLDRGFKGDRTDPAVWDLNWPEDAPHSPIYAPEPVAEPHIDRKDTRPGEQVSGGVRGVTWPTGDGQWVTVTEDVRAEVERYLRMQLERARDDRFVAPKATTAQVLDILGLTLSDGGTDG